jgi:hypothetical protein
MRPFEARQRQRRSDQSRGESDQRELERVVALHAIRLVRAARAENGRRDQQRVRKPSRT